ncbi:piggyBac transposable element-derived protein 3-like [Octopus sinensis]|uniref:PiggyBac transposable element-derived protein 3-like n=1 Tax=Octopus sinensis TaxID=2607531 RepID=A0A6P7S588_9MOLL|nr:piggyBac transposable element-derived protein 3-like [Octopus sinensis]
MAIIRVDCCRWKNVLKLNLDNFGYIGFHVDALINFPSLLITFFTSFNLLEEIQRRGHSATDTVRSNRSEKYSLTKVKQSVNCARVTEEHFLEKDSSILVAMWNDNGVAIVGSNQFAVHSIKQVPRWSIAERKQVLIQMPSVIGKYNLGGVDRLDQNISQYRITIRRENGISHFCPTLLNVCMNNAWLFSRERSYKEDLLASTRQTVQYLLKKYGTPLMNPRRQKSSMHLEQVSMRKNMTT